MVFEDPANDPVGMIQDPFRHRALLAEPVQDGMGLARPELFLEEGHQRQTARLSTGSRGEAASAAPRRRVGRRFVHR